MNTTSCTYCSEQEHLPELELVYYPCRELGDLGGATLVELEVEDPMVYALYPHYRYKNKEHKMPPWQLCYNTPLPSSRAGCPKKRVDILSQQREPCWRRGAPTIIMP
jgi:hypothetical protein